MSSSVSLGVSTPWSDLYEPNSSLQPLSPASSSMSVPQENGRDSGEEDDLSPSELDLVHARDRRRAKSLPAYPEHASALLHALSHGCRKRVRFADALGLNLASVKHFSSAEEPRVPLHLTVHPPAPAPALRVPEEGGELEARVRRCGLALERATLTCGRVHGIIRVSAGEREREVGVRYTLDDWRTYVDTRAVPVPVPALALPADRERFAFTVCAPLHPEPPEPTESPAAVHFALYLRTPGQESWDNNDGQNYTLTGTAHM